MDMGGTDHVMTDESAFLGTTTCIACSESIDLNSQNNFVTQFSLLPVLQGEAMDHLLAGMHKPEHFSGPDTDTARDVDHLLAGMQTPDYFRGTDMDTVQAMQLGRCITSNFVSGTSCPINSTVQDQLAMGMALPAGSLTTLASRYGHYENVQKFSTMDTALVYPSEVEDCILPNDYATTVSQSMGNTLNCGYGSLPADCGTRWDFNKFVDPPEISGIVSRRSALHAFHIIGNVTSDAWISSGNASMSSGSPSGSSRFSNELSLTLATSQPSVVCSTGVQDQHSDISCSGISNHSLQDQQSVHQQTPCNPIDTSSCFTSNKPSQTSHFLTGSRYLNVMQEMLADFAHFSLQNLSNISYPTIETLSDPKTCIHPCDTDSGCCSAFDPFYSFNGGVSLLDQLENASRDLDSEQKRKQILALLQVVDDQYNSLVDEIHTVISAFHAVTELDPQLHARFALQTISLMYRKLRDKIFNCILAMGACAKEERSFEMSVVQKQWALQQLKKKDQHLWRPQRGLPERSVSVLRAWMFQNFLHPYPKDAEKHLLAVKSGLTRSQVSNWFINARVRLWKPLIEEMYSETNKRKSRLIEEDKDSSFRDHIAVGNRRFPVN